MKYRLVRFTIAAAALFVPGGCGSGGGWDLIGGPPGGGTNTGDEEFTIGLMAFAGPTRVDEAERYLKLTQEQAGWQSLFVVHRDGRSELYLGKYIAAKNAERDLRRARSWKTKARVAPYYNALVVPLPGKEIGPPEWNLKSTSGAYSVAVALFYDVPEENYVGRRRFAVEYCRQLREKGEEAYFHHGPGQSAVTVGLFSQEAIREVPEPVPVQRGPPAVAWKPRIADPGILKIMQRYPLLAVNGRQEIIKVTDPVTKKVTQTEVRSYPFRIPRPVTTPDFGGFGAPAQAP